MKSDLVRRNLFSLAALAGLALLAAGSVDSNTSQSNSKSPQPSSTPSNPSTRSFEREPDYIKRLKEWPAPSATPDLDLLRVVRQNWEKGGFDSVALWHVMFWNRSDKPIGNIRYRTRYNAETGDQVDKGGVDATFGDYTIRKVIQPHQKRTIEINDGFLNRDAYRASFEIVSWEFVNPP